jgi:VIT1/CCC1 family predicted Fe2+/Mn2+ transporter
MAVVALVGDIIAQNPSVPIFDTFLFVIVVLIFSGFALFISGLMVGYVIGRI